MNIKLRKTKIGLKPFLYYKKYVKIYNRRWIYDKKITRKIQNRL